MTSSTYRTEANKYRVKCGGSLEMWESSGWITAIGKEGGRRWRDPRVMRRRWNLSMVAIESIAQEEYVGLPGVPWCHQSDLPALT